MSIDEAFNIAGADVTGTSALVVTEAIDGVEVLVGANNKLGVDGKDAAPILTEVRDAAGVVGMD